jgi:lipopolysaccharide/colanic/teichoic acid biosynthesis glycosyltransferase
VIKRTFDIIAATVGLVLRSRVLLVSSLLIMLASPGPVFIRQGRMGRGVRPFLLYRLCTMVQDAPQVGGQITFGGDPSKTRVGRVLRNTKIGKRHTPGPGHAMGADHVRCR